MLQSSKRATWTWVFVACGLVACAGHPLASTALGRALAWDAIALVALAVAWLGVRANRLDNPRPAQLLALGLTLLVAGDLIWDVSVYVFGAPNDVVPQSDLVYLGAYPLLAFGLLGLIRHRRLSREAIIDGTVVALVLAAPLWQLVIQPTIDGSTWFSLDAVITLAYPVLDAALIVVVAYLAFSVPRWCPSAWLLVGAALLITIADIVYARLSAEGLLTSTSWLDPIFPASYVLLAGALAHPSLRELARDGTLAREPLERGRVLILALSLLAVPGMLIVELETGSKVGIGLVAVASVITSSLVAWRLVRLVGETNRAHDEIAQREERITRAVTFEAGAATALEMIAQGESVHVTLEELLATTERALPEHACAVQLLDPDTGGVSSTVTAGIQRTTSLTPLWGVAITGSSAPTRRPVGVLVVHGDEALEPTAQEVAFVERAAALAAVAIDRGEVENQLEALAFHDPLTGLPNRTLLLDRLRQALLRLGRHEQGNVVVMFLDLDRFKVINDSLGHDMGDEVLLEVGRRLVRGLQASDTVARFGGDEFVVVCERISGVSEARAVAERLVIAFEEPIALSHGGLVVASASVGIALAHGPRERPEELLRDADAAMYRAKERGGTRIEVFDAALRSRVVVRLETERALRRALDRDELRVLYQPVIDLASGAMEGVEALARWQHPSRGLVGPNEFIPVAEETGLIVPIGEWVLGQACDELSLLSARTPEIVVSVNLSGRQLGRPELIDTVRELITSRGLTPECLGLEVTESVLLDDVDTAIAALSALKDLGINLAIDDFGTGYSSLGSLKQFPFDRLKIDQAFTAGLGAERDDAIVRAATEMAHALGMQVVVEGVETEVQRDRARALGCDLAQGYLFAPPRPAEEVLRPGRRLRAVR